MSFLYKPERWAYEKEVRLVKRLNEESEDGIREKTTCSKGRNLYLYNLPKHSIKEVYRVFNPVVLHGYKISPDAGGGKPAKDFRDFVVAKFEADVFAVLASQESWEFEYEKI